MLRTEDKARSRTDFLKHLYSRKILISIMFTAIPVSILLFYGIDDKNEYFFGHNYVNDYRYKTQENEVYRVGIMVSHHALLATLSIIGLLISWIGYEMFKLFIRK